MVTELLSTFDIKTIKKRTPYDVWESMGNPKYILAPMVLQSGLAFRMMCRKHGTKLCYSPMLTSKDVISDFAIDGDLHQHIHTCEGDRPLVVQLCASNANDLLNAAIIIQNNINC